LNNNYSRALVALVQYHTQGKTIPVWAAGNGRSHMVFAPEPMDYLLKC